MLDTTLRTQHHFAVYRQDMLGAAAVAAAPAIALLANTTTQTPQGFIALCSFIASAYGFLCVASMYELHMFIEDTTPRLGDSRALAAIRQIMMARGPYGARGACHRPIERLMFCRRRHNHG